MDISTFNDLLHAARQQTDPQRLVDAVLSGRLDPLIPFDREGQAVRLG